MKLPSYWAKANHKEADQHGANVAVTVWRWSDTSQRDAYESALAAARRVVQRLIQGETLDTYWYGQRPLREEILQSISDRQGQPSIAVTRNAYGSLVLNTAKVMFIDLDFPHISLAARLRSFFRRMLGAKEKPPGEQREAEMMDRIESFSNAHSAWGMRLYRTRAGLRVLVTHALFDPVADSTYEILQSLGADPLYVRLCRAQECFRARLTPKPWRCGHEANSIPWPRETEDAEAAFRRWRGTYDEFQAGYATCRFVSVFGPTAISADEETRAAVETVIEIHDHVTRCHEKLPLA